MNRTTTSTALPGLQTSPKIETDRGREREGRSEDFSSRTESSEVAVLTGGGDKPYTLVIAACIAGEKVYFDLIGSDEHAVPEVFDNSFARFFNLRGDQNPRAPRFRKLARVVLYYVRLIGYALRSKARVFHILWHNKIRWFDRTALLMYYRLLGKRLVYTAHNVNTEARDGRDSAWNRLTLKIQYRLMDHAFVHTQKMKDEIVSDYGMSPDKISVIPYGINATHPSTERTPAEARAFCQLRPSDRVILFFGNIAEYKGLDLLLKAFSGLAVGENYRLVIAGRVKCAPEHWNGIRQMISSLPDPARVIQRIEFIADEDVELYFKAADVLVLPYRTIFQSGVLFLGYNFGLPVIASDVGSLREEIIEGETGFICKPGDPDDLGRVIQKYFDSPLFQNLSVSRSRIQEYAHERYSWAKVAKITVGVYRGLLDGDGPGRHVQSQKAA